MQQTLEKANRQMDAQVTELNGRLADVQKELVEMTAQKNKAQAETADVSRRLADSESQAAQLSRLRVALAQQVLEFCFCFLLNRIHEYWVYFLK